MRKKVAKTLCKQWKKVVFLHQNLNNMLKRIFLTASAALSCYVKAILRNPAMLLTCPYIWQCSCNHTFSKGRVYRFWQKNLKLLIMENIPPIGGEFIRINLYFWHIIKNFTSLLMQHQGK